MNVKDLKSILKLLPDDKKIMLDTSENGYYNYLDRTSTLTVYNPKCTNNVNSLYDTVLLLIPTKRKK